MSAWFLDFVAKREFSVTMIVNLEREQCSTCVYICVCTHTGSCRLDRKLSMSSWGMSPSSWARYVYSSMKVWKGIRAAPPSGSSLRISHANFRALMIVCEHDSRPEAHFHATYVLHTRRRFTMCNCSHHTVLNETKCFYCMSLCEE